MANIRPAVPADARAVMELGQQMHAESKYASIPYDRDKIMKLVTTGIQRPTACGYVAEHSETGQIIGFAAAYETEYFFATGTVVSDLAVYVVPEHRDGLTGPKLVKALEAWAKERQAHSIVLGITAPQEGARTEALYQAMGYGTWGTVYRKEL